MLGLVELCVSLKIYSRYISVDGREKLTTEQLVNEFLQTMAASKESITSAAKEFINFLNKSPSPFHAVDECRQRLLSAGFTELKESDHWQVKPSDKCFVTRNQSTLIAFAVGGRFTAGNGFSVIGAHTDSPCLKVKPVSRRVKHGYVQVGVECYGGAIWHTWFDRDLKVAGRVLVRNEKKIEHRLFHVNRPIMRIPNIAIHLHREMNEKFELNKETHLMPVLATSVQEQLQTGVKSTSEVCPDTQAAKHPSVLTKLLCDELNIKAEDILDFELCLADASPSTLGGVFEEFIFSGRLDNLHSSYCALKGLLASCEGDSLSNDTNIRMVSLFDNEEVGSESAQGAGSSLQEHVMRRLCTVDGSHSTKFEEAIAKSLMISADMAHGVHPNYAEKHEEQHRPALHQGVVIKFNGNQRYATTAITASIIREVASRCHVPLQDFAVRNDSTCGSTIGPIMSAKLGLATIDLGCPQLSMHSIREMCCTTSVSQATKLFQTFYEDYPAVRSSMVNI